MRRAALLCAVLGLVAAGVGCNVVTGQHDCLYDPANMQLPPTDSQPQFPKVGPPFGGGVVTAPPVTEMPVPDKDKGK
jgi:hypothetical protein